MGSETNDADVNKEDGAWTPSLPPPPHPSLSHSGPPLVNLGSEWHKNADGGARFMVEREHHSDSVQVHSAPLHESKMAVLFYLIYFFLLTQP